MSYRSAAARAKVGQVTLTDRSTFLTLGRHAIRAEAVDHQPPRINAAQALRELRQDCRLAELRSLIESTPNER